MEASRLPDLLASLNLLEIQSMNASSNQQERDPITEKRLDPFETCSRAKIDRMASDPEPDRGLQARINWCQ